MGGSGSTLRGNNRRYSNISYDEAEQLRAKAYGMSDLDAYSEANQALRGYEGTSLSFQLNQKLRENLTLADGEQKRIERMDAAMRPLGKDLNLVRNVDTAYMKDVLGINLNGDIQKQVKIANMRMKGTILQEKGYMSTSYDASQNVFAMRPVQMRIQAPSSTKGIYGTIKRESEVVLARDSKYVIRNISLTGGKIYVDVTMLP